MRHGVLAILFGCGCAVAQPAIHLSLNEAEALAVKNHPALSAAQLNALAANQVTIEAGAARYPQLTANLTGAGAADGTRLAAGFLNNPTVFNRAAAGLTIGQMITDFGRTSNLVEAARL